jgi:Zn-dependent peptidase ImmA (M78 family)
MKARTFVRNFPNLTYPVPINLYIEAIGVGLHYETELPNNESGHSLPIKGKWHIVVNKEHLEERQRFTICHELGHIYLDLPNEHAGKGDLQRYTKRPTSEVLCDVFASEILLPSDQFKPLVNGAEMGFDAVIALGKTFKASLTATGSRFAALNDTPCTFILSEHGIVRYATRSPSLKEMRGWVQIGYRVPPSSLAAQGAQLIHDGPCTVDPTEWFEDWTRGGTLYEESWYLPEWDRMLSLLWFEEDYLPSKGGMANEEDEDSDPYCRELDGILPWPDRTKKR